MKVLKLKSHRPNCLLRTSSDFNENQLQHQNRNLVKTFLQAFVISDEICTIPSFNIILDIQVRKERKSIFDYKGKRRYE